LANTHGAMIALNRDEVKRVMDGVDFATMVKHSLDVGREPINLERLAELGELVWPGGRRGQGRQGAAFDGAARAFGISHLPKRQVTAIIFVRFGRKSLGRAHAVFPQS